MWNNGMLSETVTLAWQSHTVEPNRKDQFFEDLGVRKKKKCGAPSHVSNTILYSVFNATIRLTKTQVAKEKT